MHSVRRDGALLATLLLLLLIHGDDYLLTNPKSQLAQITVLPAMNRVAATVPPHIADAADETTANACPQGMVLIDGNYCPKVQHFCTDWLDNPKLPYARCQRYAPRSQCLTQTEHLRFCIDRDEYTQPGSTVPENQLSFTLGARLCQSARKRICQEREWNLACEGEELRPYPYGWSREPKCNQDREDLFEMRFENSKRKQRLRDLRAPSSAYPECASPYGVLNLVGNLDEPVLREGITDGPMRMALKGGWWMPGRNRCRPATTAHDVYYRDVQIGARCCADVADSR
jgi:hypothetical protein